MQCTTHPVKTRIDTFKVQSCTCRWIKVKGCQSQTQDQLQCVSVLNHVALALSIALFTSPCRDRSSQPLSALVLPLDRTPDITQRSAVQTATRLQQPLLQALWLQHDLFQACLTQDEFERFSLCSSFNTAPDIAMQKHLEASEWSFLQSNVTRKCGNLFRDAVHVSNAKQTLTVQLIVQASSCSPCGSSWRWTDCRLVLVVAS